MACSASEELTAYVDGELAPEARARFEAHLATCAECPATLAALRGMLPSLAAAIPDIEPSAQLRRNVLNALPQRRGRTAWLQLPLAVSLGLAALLLVAALHGRHANREPSDGRELMLAQNLEVVQNLGALETADLSDEDLEVVANLDQLEAKQ